MSIRSTFCGETTSSPIEAQQVFARPVSALLQNMLCDIVFPVRLAAAVACVVLACVPVRGEMALTDSAPAEPAKESVDVAVLRSYEVREDPESGRLIRRAFVKKGVREARKSTSRSQGRPVVQGAVAGPKSGRVDLNALVERFARQYEVTPELVHAVIRQESGYDPFAVSRKGAQGLMQLMPETAAELGVKDVFDPAENVHGGIRFLRTLIDRYEGDVELALAAYNAGPAAVDRHSGVPPYRETQEYLARIVGAADRQDVSSDREAERRIAVMVTAEGGLHFGTTSQ